MAKFKLVREATKYNPYAVGMAVAKKAAGLGKTPTHDLPKAIITKAHDIAKRIKSNEEFDDLLLADIIDEVKETPITMPDNPDYSKYDKPTFQRKNPKPEHKMPEYVGKNTDKPAYKRKAENEGK